MEQPLGSGIQKLQTVVGVMEVISAIPAPVGGFVMLWEMSETVEGKLMKDVYKRQWWKDAMSQEFVVSREELPSME